MYSPAAKQQLQSSELVSVDCLYFCIFQMCTPVAAGVVQVGQQQGATAGLALGGMQFVSSNRNALAAALQN